MPDANNWYDLAMVPRLRVLSQGLFSNWNRSLPFLEDNATKMLCRELLKLLWAWLRGIVLCCNRVVIVVLIHENIITFFIYIYMKSTHHKNKKKR